jgi:hypothetical protein
MASPETKKIKMVRGGGRGVHRTGTSTELGRGVAADRWPVAAAAGNSGWGGGDGQSSPERRWMTSSARWRLPRGGGHGP